MGKGTDQAVVTLATRQGPHRTYEQSIARELQVGAEPAGLHIGYRFDAISNQAHLPLASPEFGAASNYRRRYRCYHVRRLKEYKPIHKSSIKAQVEVQTTLR
jgi:hypothetical protein